MFDEKTLEVNFISDYLTVTTPLPQYLPYARFLLDTDLSHTAKLLYTLLLDRATLFSKRTNWDGMSAGFRLCDFFPAFHHLSDALRCSTMSIKRALRSLEDADLIERRRSRIAVPKQPLCKSSDSAKTFLCMERFCSVRWNRNDAFHGTKSVPLTNVIRTT